MPSFMKAKYINSMGRSETNKRFLQFQGNPISNVNWDVINAKIEEENEKVATADCRPHAAGKATSNCEALW